jgi:hypothetical protein
MIDTTLPERRSKESSLSSETAAAKRYRIVLIHGTYSMG